MAKPAQKFFSAIVGLLSTILVLSASGLRAQQSITVSIGDTAISSKDFKPHQASYQTSVVLPDGKSYDTGIFSEEIRRKEINGKPVIEVVQTWGQKVHKEVNPGWAARGLTMVNWTLTNVVDGKTLAPAMSSSMNDLKNYQQIEFDGLTVKETNSTRPPSDNVLKSETKLERPVFNYQAGLFGLLLARFPLKEGYSARIPTYKPSSGTEAGKLEWVSFKVTGKETVTTSTGKKFAAWVVEVDDKNTFWLSSESPYVIKSVNLGTPNRKWLFEVR